MKYRKIELLSYYFYFHKHLQLVVFVDFKDLRE